jgi:type VI secretion system protein ImpB
MSTTQHKLDKARPPRVQITYDVEIGESTTSKELPLVIGVLGDFSQAEDSLRDRNFITIDKDNFNDVMASMHPSVSYLVENALSEESAKFPVSLTFKNIEDFSPDKVAAQIEPLCKLVKLREQLSELRNRAASNQLLKEELEELALNLNHSREQTSDKIENVK